MGKRLRQAAVVAAIIAAGVAAAVLLRGARVDCPAGTRADRARQARVAERLRVGLASLRAHADAGALANAWRDGDSWCFGDGSELREGGTLVLDAGLDDVEAACRAGHLLMHRLVAPPWLEAAGPCAERVNDAIAAEARAISLELELRRALGVTGVKVAYAFAAEHDGALPGERIALIQKALLEHPDGAPGIPDLAGAYARRCRAQGTPKR